MFERYDSLGFMSKYYIKKDKRLLIRETFSDIYREAGGEKRIDPVAVIELLNNNYFFMDRTLVRGIYKTPWMARPSADHSHWLFADLPEHGSQKMDVKEAARELFARLQEEIMDYCREAETVGILLSGGMDSRIAAGVLNELISSGRLKVRVAAITWGREESRDVIYARRIAGALNWEWYHYPLSPENLLENIDVAARLGCEFSPLHLHAMPRVREMAGVDCILAGSYGDSVGRAEYSGSHVTGLKSLGRGIINRFKILNQRVFSRYQREVAEDIELYNRRFSREKAHQRYEIERQAHYMRRQLNPCMAYIDQQINLHQVFTSPDVFGFMWSLSPEVRNNKIYYYILKELAGVFRTTPWSRTGRPYLEDEAAADNYKKNYHKYGEWIRDDLYPIIRDRVLSERIEGLNLFNMDALEALLDFNRRLSRSETHTRIDELLIWLAALADCTRLYDLQGVEEEAGYLDKLIDRLNGVLVSRIMGTGYLLAKRVF